MLRKRANHERSGPELDVAFTAQSRDGEGDAEKSEFNDVFPTWVTTVVRTLAITFKI